MQSTLKRVITFVVEKSSNRRSFSLKVGQNFTRCHSHRCTFAMEDIMLKHNTVITIVSANSAKHLYPIYATYCNLIDILPLSASTWQEKKLLLRYSCNMLRSESFFTVSLTPKKKEAELLLILDKNDGVDELLEVLVGLNLVTLYLQRDNTTVRHESAIRCCHRNVS